MKKAEILNDLITSVFTSNCPNQTAQVAEGKGRDLENKDGH